MFLGSSLTIWTTHVHPTASISKMLETLVAQPASLVISIFPERDTGCQVQVHDKEEVNTASCNPSDTIGCNLLINLISIDTFANDGREEMADAQLLVCVTAIGQPSACG